ncbi:MAG: hypothetical protein ACJAQ2_001807 [Vicingaceae bacterium]|jgi:hypothetical protein
MIEVKMIKKLSRHVLCFGLIFITFGSSNSCYSKDEKGLQESNKKKITEEVEITYLKNQEYPKKNVQGIDIKFLIGFDTVQEFSIFLNDSLVNKFSCKTNYSIGYCTIGRTSEMAGYYLPNDAFEEGDVLKISTLDYIVEFDLKEKMKDYNRLDIDKATPWRISFENSSSPIIVE